MRTFDNRLMPLAGLALLLLCWMVPAAASDADSSATEAERAALLSEGWQLYQRYCKTCHGDQGLGDGHVAKYLTVAVPDLTQIRARRDGVFPEEMLHKLIDGREAEGIHGRREMPIWGDVFRTDEEEAGEAKRKIAALIEFLRSIDASEQAEPPSD